MDLIDAIIKKDISALKEILEAGADPNLSDDGDNVTPLHHAVTAGSLEIVELLLAAGANPKSKDICGQSPLDCAKKLKRGEIESALLKNSSQKD